MKTLLFDRNIRTAITLGKDAFGDFPASRKALARFLAYLPKAAKRRSVWAKRNVVVPPLLIVSTTRSCNLRCAGCYAQTQGTGDEMTKPQIDGLMAQAVDIGCAVMLLAGGEPLLSDAWLEAVASRSELLGLVFTNGTLLDDKRADWFAAHRSMIPLFSVEGDARRTDERRGDGVARCVEQAMGRLKERKIPFGLSVTTGEHNIQDVTNLDFLEPFVALGCRLCVYTEYVPVDENTQLLALSEDSKRRLTDFCEQASKKANLVLITFPGDETMHNGCLAAGRGFAHVSASGELEPCPFAPASDRNVLRMPLADALASPLFRKIRSESHLLHEGVGGCALRNRL